MGDRDGLNRRWSRAEVQSKRRPKARTQDTLRSKDVERGGQKQATKQLNPLSLVPKREPRSNLISCLFRKFCLPLRPLRFYGNEAACNNKWGCFSIKTLEFRFATGDIDCKATFSCCRQCFCSCGSPYDSELQLCCKGDLFCPSFTADESHKDCTEMLKIWSLDS